MKTTEQRLKQAIRIRNRQWRALAIRRAYVTDSAAQFRGYRRFCKLQNLTTRLRAQRYDEFVAAFDTLIKQT